MRFFTIPNAGKVAILIRFDEEQMATATWDGQQWAPDTEFNIDVVSGMNTEAQEVNEADVPGIQEALAA